MYPTNAPGKTGGAFPLPPGFVLLVPRVVSITPVLLDRTFFQAVEGRTCPLNLVRRGGGHPLAVQIFTVKLSFTVLVLTGFGDLITGIQGTSTCVFFFALFGTAAFRSLNLLPNRATTSQISYIIVHSLLSWKHVTRTVRENFFRHKETCITLFGTKVQH